MNVSQELQDSIKRYNSECEFFKIESERYINSMKILVKFSNMVFEQARKDGFSDADANKLLEISRETTCKPK